MKFVKHRLFEKSFKKLPKELKIKFQEQLEIFSVCTTDKRLDNHALQGKYLGYRSIKLTGDYRIIFKEIDQGVFLLVNVGTHSQLYG